MRRLASATVSAAVVSLLVLAGCSGTDSGGSASPTPSESAGETPAADAAQPEATPEDVAALEAVTVEGEPGSEPTLGFEQPFTVSAPVARVVTPGTGAELEEGQTLSLNVFEVSGEDGTSLNSTYGAEPFKLALAGAQMPPIIGDVLVGQAVGVRVLLAAPSQEGATVITALEVAEARTLPTRAEGTPVEPAAGLPEVTLAEDGAPSITPVEGEPPTELVVQPLITGSGPVVEAGQSVTAHYTGWLWDGEQFDSSWERGAPSTFSLDQVVAGWSQGLAGQTVGSQVLLVIPPELGYGAEENGSIPANSTLVFVVDILDAS